MAFSDTRTLTEQTAPAPTSATTPTISCPPTDTDAAIDLLEARPPALTRPEQVSPLTVVNGTPPRVLVITLEDGHKMNPFQVAQALARFGTVTDVYRPSVSEIEVKMSTEAETEGLLSATSLTYLDEGKSNILVPVSVAPHPTKNSAIGVITCRELTDSTEEEVLSGMVDQGVTKVRRMNRKTNGKLVATNTFVLTFRTKVLPKTVRVGWLSIRVRTYVPDPTRCYRCQRYGHVAKTCKGHE